MHALALAFSVFDITKRGLDGPIICAPTSQCLTELEAPMSFASCELRNMAGPGVGGIGLIANARIDPVQHPSKLYVSWVNPTDKPIVVESPFLWARFFCR